MNKFYETKTKQWPKVRRGIFERIKNENKFTGTKSKNDIFVGFEIFKLSNKNNILLD